jgi:RNA polymerase sigma-70 factor (ECF subfamily)
VAAGRANRQTKAKRERVRACSLQNKRFCEAYATAAVDLETLVSDAQPIGGALGEDDTTLARALVNGDPRAPRVTWNRFRPLVRRMVVRLMGSAPDVEDLVQEVFLRFFNRILTIQDPAALKAFLVSISINVVRSEMRRRSIRRAFYVREDFNPTTVLLDPEAREALVHLDGILDRLGTQDRVAFVLRFVEEMEIEGVAGALGISISTVKRRLARSWRKVAVQVRRDPALSHYLSRKGVGDSPPAQSASRSRPSTQRHHAVSTVAQIL